MEEEAPEVEAVISSHNREKIALNGHYYNYVETLKSNGLRVYRCNKKNSMSCKGRAYVDPRSGAVTEVNEHTNDPDPAKIKADSVVSAMRKRALDTVEMPAHVVATLLDKVFVILGRRGELVQPLCYALLPNKTFAAYDRLFSELRESWPGMNPQAIYCDFESALQSAIRSQFPNARLAACYFHRAQNLWRSIQRNGLAPRYNNEPAFNLWVRMVAAMPYVPPRMLKTALKVLKKKAPAELEAVLEWLEKNYVGRLDDELHTPQFPPASWSCYYRIRRGEDKTNNLVEAHHKKASFLLQCSHPTLWRFIDHLRRVQQTFDLEYEEYVRGDQPTKKRAKYVDADERILAIISGERRTVTEYLRGIAANIACGFFRPP